MANVLLPLPARDFDPTEVAVSWKLLRGAGHEVVFATPDGRRSFADDLMISGEGLDPWGFLPGVKKLTLLGNILRANADGRAAYAELEQAPAFLNPLTYEDVRLEQHDGLLLAGGHRARGMRPYLESTALQGLIVLAFQRETPVAAVCHGVLLVARSIDGATGRSVLFGRRTTSLTWSQESLASKLARVARFWDGGYYRTYVEKPGEPCGYMGVQQEVTRALAKPEDYADVPKSDPDYKQKTDGRHRDTVEDARPAFVVRDGSYVSARWPGDVHTFARTFAGMIDE